MTYSWLTTGAGMSRVNCRIDDTQRDYSKRRECNWTDGHGDTFLDTHNDGFHNPYTGHGDVFFWFQGKSILFRITASDMETTVCQL